MSDFKLAASFSGHDDDVRAVKFASSFVLSASRDATVRKWQLTATTSDSSILSQSDTFVNAVTYIRPSDNFHEGLVVSGGKDALIDVRPPSSGPETDPERLLLGHEGNICALDSFSGDNKSYIISGSWDGSARIWDVDKGQETACLTGHEGAVWDVLALDSSQVITACADTKIRVFSTHGKLQKQFQASSQPVRALCRLSSDHTSGAQFASAGNDNTIHLWTIEGVKIAELNGHENFIYSLAASPAGEIFSCSEDRTLRVWQNGACIQTITHPAISVWSVDINSETGDIVSGASDRVVRVFTRSKARTADAATITAFEESVKASSIPQQTMDQINKDKLPGPDFLKKKSGTKEGQIQMIREFNGNVTAHQWSTQANQWVAVGTVVDSQGSTGRKITYQGQEYDYVFDVDIEDGKPPLKLPFNLSQNPYDAARKFLADNELPISYLEQTAAFIVQNTQGATLGAGSETGGGSDPWGTGARYRPGDADAGSQPAVSSTATAPSRKLPQKEFLTITTINMPTVTKKIMELNERLISEGQKDASFSPGDIKQLSPLTGVLSKSLDSPSPDQELNILTDFAVKIATTWPAAMRLPGLDLYRCLSAASTNLVERHPPLVTLKESGAFQSNENFAMLGFRSLANLFIHPSGRGYVQQHFDEIRQLASPYAQPSQGAAPRNLQLAITTLYINFAVLLTTVPGPDPTVNAKRAFALLGDLSTLLSHVVDSEVVYRGLVSLGTLLRVPPPSDGTTIDTQPIVAALAKVSSKTKEPRNKELIAEIQQLI